MPLKAYCLVRDAPWYRRQAFVEGLKLTGYEVSSNSPARGAKGDVLVLWNRYGGWHDIASQFEREGGTVVVAENGYLGRGGTPPKFDVHPEGPKPEHYYSISLGWHNGRGRWHVGGPERFATLEVVLKPWRSDGEHILVCPNRSFGVGEQVMQPDWAQRAADRVRRQTKRPVRIRAHPGNNQPKRSLAEDLKGAWAVVVWSSSVALHSLVEGIPVFIEAPFQIVKGAGARGSVDSPETPERLPHFERMAWAQWTIEEISTGLPFAHCLRAA